MTHERPSVQGIKFVRTTTRTPQRYEQSSPKRDDFPHPLEPIAFKLPVFDSLLVFPTLLNEPTKSDTEQLPEENPSR